MRDEVAVFGLPALGFGRVDWIGEVEGGKIAEGRNTRRC